MKNQKKQKEPIIFKASLNLEGIEFKKLHIMLLH